MEMLGSFWSGLLGLAWSMLDMEVPYIGLTFKQIYIGMFIISISWIFIALIKMVSEGSTIINEGRRKANEKTRFSDDDFE